MLWQYSDGKLPNGGVKCRWARQKSRFWTNSWLSIDDWWNPNNKCDGDHAVYRTDGDASVNLCLLQPAAYTTTTKRRQQNRIYLYVAVNLKRKKLITEDCARRIVLMKLLTDTKHRAAVLRQQRYL